MEATSQEGMTEYTTPRWVQVWFLRRSRNNWKRKYQQLKADAKRLRNHVNDAIRSREKWRERAEGEAQRVKELQAQNAALREQAALKKYGQRDRAAAR